MGSGVLYIKIIDNKRVRREVVVVVLGNLPVISHCVRSITACRFDVQLPSYWRVGVVNPLPVPTRQCDYG